MLEQNELLETESEGVLQTLSEITSYHRALSKIDEHHEISEMGSIGKTMRKELWAMSSEYDQDLSGMMDQSINYPREFFGDSMNKVGLFRQN